MNLILQTTQIDSVKVETVKELIKYYVRAKEYDTAEIYAFEFQKLAIKSGTDDLLGKAYYNMGIVKWLQGKQTESNDYLEKSIPYLIATPDSITLSKCYTKIGTNYLRVSGFAQAIENYTQSYQIRSALKDSTGMANNLINIAGCYYQMAKYDISIRTYHDALSIAENISNQKLIAYNFNNIGNIYLKTQDYQNAIEYLLKAKDANEKLHNEGELSKNLLNLANAYQQIGDTANAEIYYLQSAAIKEKLKDFEGLSETYNSLGSINKNLDRIDEALVYYQKAYELIKLGNDRFAEASVIANIGSIYLSRKQPEASFYFLKSLEIAKEIKARHLIINAYSNLISYYRMFNNNEEAVKFYEQLIMLNDTIYNETTAEAIAEMNAKYETEKKVQENEILRKDIQIEQNAKEFFIIAISGLLLLLFASVYLVKLKSNSLKQINLLHLQEKELSKLEMEKKEVEKEHLEDKVFAEKQLNRLQREKYEAELARKNEKLANSALNIVNKNEVLSGIKEKILETSMANDGEKFIPDLIREINNNIDVDQNWQMFRLQFEEVHPGFFDKLKRKHPDLSSSYIQLAAYIRINLSTNEIAQLLYITVAAVKKSRQRLRKKLGLKAEASLFEYISGV